MIDKDGNESKTIFEAHLLQELKVAKQVAVTEFFNEMVAECSGSDNGVDAVLDDYVTDNSLRPFMEYYVRNIKAI